MNLDQDLRDRFNQVAPHISDIDQGAIGAQQASGRRTAVGRAAAVAVTVIALLVGYAAFTGLSNDSSSEIFTTDPNPEEEQDTSGEQAPATSTPATTIQPDDELEAEPEPNEDNGPAPTAPENVTSQVPGAEAVVSSIVGVDANDTLNARSGPGTDFDVSFEFAHDASGVVQTGNSAVSDDGATWVEVFAPTSGTELDAGWVNTAFLSETAVLDTGPCLFNGPQDHYIGIDWANAEGDPNSDAAVISNIETYRFGGCIRTVFEFSNDWSYALADNDPGRANTLPIDIVVTRDSPPRIDFGASIEGAEAVSARFAERGGVSQSTFVFLTGAERELDAILYGPTSTMTARFDNINGRVIIDIADIRLPDDASPEIVERVGPTVAPIIDEGELILTNVASSVDSTRWTFTGLARPFESTLGIIVTNTAGEPVDVRWTNGVNSIDSYSNGVMTSTWTEALGHFSFTITLLDGINPEDVVVQFDQSGGAADEPTTIDVGLAQFVG